MVESLQHLALEVCSRFPENTLLKKEDGDDTVLLREEAFLPATLCEPLLAAIVKTRPFQYVEMFTNREKCQLRKLKLSNQKLKGFQNLVEALLEHSLEEIDFSDSYLDISGAEKLGNTGKNLQRLNLSGTKGQWTRNGAPFLQKLQNVTNLDVSCLKVPFGKCVRSISCMMSLVSLDLSETEIESILPLVNLSSSLQQLYLFDTNLSIDDFAEELQKVLPQLKCLTHLDISKEYDMEDSYFRTTPYLTIELLEEIASLPNLIYLDISACKGLKETDLVSFRKALSRKLQFLGLFGTNLEHFSDLPADKISGVANEQQLLISMQLYVKRATYIETSFHSLFECIQDGEVESPEKGLQMVISSTKFHVENERLQIAASACIFHILRTEEAAHFGAEIRRSTISLLMDVMAAHKQSNILLNCLQCLCNFNIPAEVEFAAVTLCKQLLRILKLYPDQTMCRIAVLIFNAVVCHTSAIKVELGQYGAVKTLLDVIKGQSDQGIVGEFLENCWCALWNITDEAPENCEDFVNNNGLGLFKTFINDYEGETGLQRSILGLMGNIAEVQKLRCEFLEDEVIKLLVRLLDSESFDFEVSYNAAGILSHVCSDGDAAWRLKTISRNDCMKFVSESIAKWDVGSSRNINYRSLKPILRLLPLDFNPCGQEWAVWALANLTNVYPDKYCKLLKSEGGMDLLKRILETSTATKSMKKYADLTITKIREKLW